MIKLGMKVLFIAPQFFGYEQEIKGELEQAGYHVDWFDDRPSTTPLVKALIRFKPELIGIYTDKYFDHILENIQKIQYDFVFIVKGEALSISHLKQLRQNQTQAKFLYYTWDSFKNFKNGQAKLAYFDKAYSFDRDDCLTYPTIMHLPLFYIEAYERIASIKTDHISLIDLLFLGSIHSDRYSVIQKIWAAAREVKQDIKLYDHFFYQSRWVFLVRKIFDQHFRSIPWHVVKWASLNTDETLQLIKNCQIIVDVNHPQQKGLTMRTIESLGAHKKLITTNKDVFSYDFYQPDNILVIDRYAPIIPYEFLTSNYAPLAPEIYNKYRLASWIREIFS